MNHYVIMSDKLASLIVSLEKATTAVNCLEETRAREISSRNLDKAIGDIRELQKAVQEWGAEPDVNVVTYNQPPELVLHEIEIWEVRGKDGMQYLHDGTFNRVNVHFGVDTFPLTLERLNVTNIFKAKLDELFRQKAKGIKLNKQAIRKHASIIWHNIMATDEDSNATRQYMDQFNHFLEHIELHVETIQALRVDTIPVFSTEESC